MDGRIQLNIEVLKKLRHERCFTQEVLVQKCLEKNIHISVATIKRAEKGNSVLYRTASALSQFYQLPIEELMDKELNYNTNLTDF